MIQVENLSKKFGHTFALNSLSFSIQKNDVIGFLGPNGAGKTTLMRLLTGIISPTSGTITIQDYSYLTHSYEIRSLIGYLPEYNPLYLDMTVKEFLSFIAGIRHIPPPTRSASIDLAIQRCHLESVYSQVIRTCSKGFRQRIGIAQAILHHPKILILDEPTSGLDPHQILDIRHLIQTLAKDTTIILSSHILSEVTATCRSVFILNHGCIVTHQSIDALRHSMTQTFLLESTIPKESFIQLLDAHSIAASILSYTQKKSIHAFTFQCDYDCRQDIYRMFKDTSWIIQELSKQSPSLEHIFISLTRQDSC